jgi:hypothetical protein
LYEASLKIYASKLAPLAKRIRELGNVVI